MGNGTPTVYVIPGLGTDCRIYSKLPFPGLQPIEWLMPKSREESLEAYSQRMALAIKAPHPILIGNSFGGVVAQEISQKIPLRKLILISSIQSEQELPPFFQFMRTLPLYQLTQGSWRTRTLPYWGRWFGVKDDAECALLQDMFRRHSDAYRMWAIRQLVNWQANPLPISPIHLHGTRDKVFPIKYIRSCIPIEGGDHFMVYRCAAAVAEVLRAHLV